MVNNSSVKVSYSSPIDFSMENVRTSFSITLTDGVSVSASTVDGIMPYIRAGGGDGAIVWRMESDAYESWQTPYASVWKGQVYTLKQTISEVYDASDRLEYRHVALKQMKLQFDGCSTTARQVTRKRINKARREENRLAIKEGFAD